MDITIQHPRYAEFAGFWQLMRDAFDGEDAVKLRGETYLPMKSGTYAMTDYALRNQTYLSYKSRAEFPELVSPTVRGTVGIMLETPAVVELPKKMEGLIEKATRNGSTLETFHRQIANELMITGRYGILPGIDQDGEGYLAGYTAESIINWDTQDEVPNYLVLDECGIERNPETNIWTTKERYRECYMEDGRYTSREWERTAQGLWSPVANVVALKPPKMGQVQGLEELPFVFINTNGLQADPDDVPLYGLAKIALRIYRLDADYTFAMHMTSEPTPVAMGFDDPAEAIKSGAAPSSIGASKLWILPKGADAKYLEFSGAGIGAQKDAIQASLDRAVALGAQILTDQKRSAESGEALKMRLGNQASTLKQVAMTSAAGLEKALKNLAVWMNVDPESVSVEPNLDFYDHTLNAQEIGAIVKGWQDGAYSWQTSFERLQKGGVIPEERTADEEQELIAEDQANMDLQAEQDIDPRTGLPIPAAVDPLTGLPIKPPSLKPKERVANG
jgi:hypothetical protein